MGTSLYPLYAQTSATSEEAHINTYLFFIIEETIEIKYHC